MFDKWLLSNIEWISISFCLSVFTFLSPLLVSFFPPVHSNSFFLPSPGCCFEYLPSPLGVLYFSVLCCFSATLHLHPAALWCCCLGAGWQKSLHQLDLRMGREGVGWWWVRRKGCIKNQSNWNGIWRQRTPCETVDHVPLLKMGQEFTVLIFFSSVLFLCYMSLRPYVYLWPCLFMLLLALYLLNL